MAAPPPGALEPLRAALLDGAAGLGLALSDREASALLAYGALLLQWSRLHNLTALRDPDAILRLHLLDCLAAVGPLRRHAAECGLPSPSILDVGSGAGLPGAVVAVLMPQARVTCVDAVAKKAAFVRQAALELSLHNLDARHARVETLAPVGADVVVSRAFASLADFVTMTRRHLAPRGAWMAMKGRLGDDEAAGLPQNTAVFHVEQLAVPGLDAARCLVWMRPA